MWWYVDIALSQCDRLIELSVLKESSAFVEARVSLEGGVAVDWKLVVSGLLELEDLP